MVAVTTESQQLQKDSGNLLPQTFRRQQQHIIVGLYQKVTSRGEREGARRGLVDWGLGRNGDTRRKGRIPKGGEEGGRSSNYATMAAFMHASLPQRAHIFFYRAYVQGQHLCLLSLFLKT